MRNQFNLSACFIADPQACNNRPLTDIVDDALRAGATFIRLIATMKTLKKSLLLHAILHKSSKTITNAIL